MQAILVGIGEYQHLSPLAYANRDVDKVLRTFGLLENVAVAAKLSSAEGKILRVDVYEALQQAIGKAETARDGLFLYFSGHGTISRKHRFLLCAHDYRPGVDASGILLDEVVELVREVHGPAIIVIDCCRSALETSDFPSSTGRALDSPPVISVTENVRIFFSCRWGERSFESPDEDVAGSLFTHALCQGMMTAGKGKYLTLLQLYHHIEASMTTLLQDAYFRWTQQELVEVIQFPTIVGGDFNRFCFSRKPRPRARKRSTIDTPSA